MPSSHKPQVKYLSPRPLSRDEREIVEAGAERAKRLRYQRILRGFRSWLRSAQDAAGWNGTGALSLTARQFHQAQHDAYESALSELARLQKKGKR